MHWVVWMRILFHSISKHYRLIYSSQIHVNHYICIPHIQFIHNLSNLKPVKNQREKNGNCTVLKARSHHSHSNQNVSTSHLKKKGIEMKLPTKIMRITERKIKRMDGEVWRCGGGEQSKDLREDGRLTVTGRDENEWITTSQQKQLKKITFEQL